MKQVSPNIADAVALLERTPASLSALLDGLSETWIRATEGEGTWSPYDVIGHLVHGERTDWIPRARHILAGDGGPFAPFDREAQLRESQDKSLSELLATFADLRQENVAILVGMNLTEKDLERTGLHPELGQVTLGQHLATWVAHDLDHVAQIARTMAKVYREATGPWSKYLSILRDRPPVPKALAAWYQLIEDRNPEGLDALLADHVVFHSPNVETPQRGKEVAAQYLTAALRAFFNESFRYVREVTRGRDAILEFQVEIDGETVNGVDMITWNDAGQIVDFKVMIRPLKGIKLVHQKIAAQLQANPRA